MAELYGSGGQMEPTRRPSGRRSLLPAEAELCNFVGITVDEYFEFVELTERYTGERPQGYELVPDVRNDPVTLFVINLVVGLALSAISYLLAPKPQEPKTPPQKRTNDVKGRTKFAPQTGFDSLQDLAVLGDIIPLIFTRKGVRVQGQLLWSQMLSMGTGQQLRVIVLFSHGQIEQRPDFAGYAIGDSTLKNYVNAKLALYFKLNGGRILEGGTDRYTEGTLLPLPNSDVFSVYWNPTGGYQPYFSGTRTPQTQAQFGVYNPVPNGMRWKLDYELILTPNQSEDNVRDDLQTKRSRMRHSWPRRSALSDVYGGTVAKGSRGASADQGAYSGQVIADQDFITYVLASGEEAKGQYKPWGVEDVRTAIQGEREESDAQLNVGDQYLAGSALVICTNVSTIEPWDPKTTKEYVLKVIEPGYVDTRGWLNTETVFDVSTLQRVAIGTVSNTRQCSATEIGIKSTVWRQITGFPNVNSHPGSDTIHKFEDDNGSFTLGAVTKYIRRLSFFQVFARPLGTSDSSWVDISGGTLFCVRGRTPQPFYNFIRVFHAFGQYEFRFKPFPGNLAKKLYTDRTVNLLRSDVTSTYSASEYTVVYSGAPMALTIAEMCNDEWVLGSPPSTAPIGKVISMDRYAAGDPTAGRWILFDERGGQNNRVIVSEGIAKYVWDDESKGTTPESQTELVVSGLRKWVTGSLMSQETVNGVLRKYYRISKYNWSTENPLVFNDIALLTGGSGTNCKVNLKVYANGAATWTLRTGGTGYKNKETLTVPRANVTVAITTDEAEILEANLNRYDAVADVPLYNSERSSHLDGPEHEIVYVNEQIVQNAPLYENLAIGGLRLNSTKEWTSFSSLSAYFKRGVVVERLSISGRSATNLLPEIVYALLTDPVIGAGKLIGAAQVDRARMVTAAMFCEANGFTWDGVLSQKENLRSWIFDMAGYCLLDFTILGGRFSLVPSVPYTAGYAINALAAPEIKALFTDGNIRNLSVSFLSPEERQLFKAVCTWRFEKENGFPEARTVVVRLSAGQGGSDQDPEETFQMDAFCTTQEHPIKFAKYALKTRKLVDHGLKFETTPQAAMGLAPGDYFRLVSEATHTSRFRNGSIGPDGSISCAEVLSGSYSILYWAPGTVGVSSTTLTATGNRTSQSNLYGTVFAIASTTTTNRVYKVESLSYTEDGFVEVAGSFVPLTGGGTLAVLDWPDSDFVIELG